MNVSVVMPTRGNVDLMPIVESYPDEWQVVVYNNGAGHVQVMDEGREEWDIIEHGLPDLAVYARYAAIQYASHDLIVTQDDDVIVSDPQAIVDRFERDYWGLSDTDEEDRFLVANMPQEFRHDGYTDSCLVGFGACFHRDLPRRAFERFDAMAYTEPQDFFYRTCDVVFTTLTPRVLVDVPKEDREFASDDDRMWRQPDHVGERARMLELARTARDAT